LKIITWNVNSIRARHDRLLALLERHQPDAVCLQETKVVDESFPFDALKDVGYSAAVSGQKTYNGVAVLARGGLEDAVLSFDDGVDDPQARMVAATVEGVRVISVYVPNGRSVGSEAYDYKLEWLGRLRRFIEKTSSPDQPLVVAGDFNVAPGDLDVHDPEAWRGGILCSDAERSALDDLMSWGLTDAFRRLYPDKVAYSWWDYRQLGFPKNRGLRIDHLLMTEPLLARCKAVEIDREERKGKGASDHAPVVADLD
jgi:exodeoxyribonuclease-3